MKNKKYEKDIVQSITCVEIQVELRNPWRLINPNDFGNLANFIVICCYCCCCFQVFFQHTIFYFIFLGCGLEKSGLTILLRAS